MLPFALLLVVSSVAWAQLSIRPAARERLTVAGNRLVDEHGEAILLQGTQAPVDLDLARAGTMFSTLRQRWNMNMVRLPVSVTRGERDPAYLPLITEFVRRANQAELYVILAAVEEDAPLPTQRSVDFWKRWAAHFRDHPLVLFDLFQEPVADLVPGHRAGIRTEAEWQFWRAGGIDARNGRRVGMQTLAETVRAAGARQPVIAMVFDDPLLMDGFSDRWFLTVPGVIYEVCPRNSFHASNAARDLAFGFLATKVPLLAAGWDPELA